MRTRTCLTIDTRCVCEGYVRTSITIKLYLIVKQVRQSTVVEYCNVEICRYPRSTCCYNFKVTTYNGIFACLPDQFFYKHHDVTYMISISTTEIRIDKIGLEECAINSFLL
ncbi:hypothetical protein COOONC_04096 [Cooperia oncophora]